MSEKQKQKNEDFLIAIFQNIQTAKQSISNVIEKVKDSKLKKELKAQYKDYDRLSETCEDLAKVYGFALPDNSFFQKAKMWFSVNMSTMLDKSNRKIASINIFGTTMGIVDIICVISDCNKCKEEILHLAKELQKLEESNVEKLKPFLLKENNKPKPIPKAVNSSKSDVYKKENTEKPNNSEKAENNQ